LGSVGSAGELVEIHRDFDRPILRPIAHLAGVRAVRQTIEGVVRTEAPGRFRKPDDDEEFVAVEAYLIEGPSRARVRAPQAKVRGHRSKQVFASPARTHSASLSSRNRTTTPPSSAGLPE
jgi:predicted RNA-binding Zn ribbon-like protein